MVYSLFLGKIRNDSVFLTEETFQKAGRLRERIVVGAVLGLKVYVFADEINAIEHEFFKLVLVSLEEVLQKKGNKSA